MIEPWTDEFYQLLFDLSSARFLNEEFDNWARAVKESVMYDPEVDNPFQSLPLPWRLCGSPGHLLQIVDANGRVVASNGAVDNLANDSIYAIWALYQLTAPQLTERPSVRAVVGSVAEHLDALSRAVTGRQRDHCLGVLLETVMAFVDVKHRKNRIAAGEIKAD